MLSIALFRKIELFQPNMASETSGLTLGAIKLDVRGWVFS